MNRGAAPFAGKDRLQLASIQAAESVLWVKKMFRMMTNLWRKKYFNSQMRAEKLKAVQPVLYKSSRIETVEAKQHSTRWLSHECCM